MKAKATVLIVDDIPDNIRLLANILQDDYRILMATNGPRAIEIARSELPDLLLLDVMMPEMDGHQVLVSLQGSKETEDIPIIFVTSLDEIEDQAIGLEMGAIDYLTKPIHPMITKLRVKNQLELKQNRDHLTRLALVDGLTGIANRRQFDDTFKKEWRRAQRSKYPLSLMLVDIDYFKLYNDKYGHQQGDDCLVRVAQCIQNCLHRPTDLAARYGGEEFVCLLVDTDLEGGQKVAENAGLSISAMDIRHAKSNVADHVTASIGLATVQPDRGAQASDLIKKADERLYEAKELGRNRIVF